MRCRPVDENGDMMPCNKMLEGSEAIGVAVRSRLRLFYGDWWENRTIGFEIPRFLFEGVRRDGVSMLAGYISAYIKATEGVIAVDGNMDFFDHEANYQCVITTEEGERFREELNGNGLSGALR